MRLLGGVLAALAGLAILGGSLNYFYRSQRARKAQAFQQAANRLLAQARYDEAVPQYRNALSISHSVDDRLGLALALVRADAAGEASLYLNEVLQSRPQSGPANLAESQQGQVDDAISRFQRAADGSWTERPEENRVEARMELVETLARAGRSAQAKAELLSLAAQLPNDPVIQEKVGQMLTDFGLLRESAGLFHAIAQRHPQDATAYQGWGEAQFQMGDYAAALETFRRGLVLHPSNQTAAQRIEACENILALDPTIRGSAWWSGTKGAKRFCPVRSGNCRSVRAARRTNLRRWPMRKGRARPSPANAAQLPTATLLNPIWRSPRDYGRRVRLRAKRSRLRTIPFDL